MSGLSLDMEQFLIAAADKIPHLSGMKFNSSDMYEFQRCLDTEPLMEQRFLIMKNKNDKKPMIFFCKRSQVKTPKHGYVVIMSPMYSTQHLTEM